MKLFFIFAALLVIVMLTSCGKTGPCEEGCSSSIVEYEL